MKSLVILLSMLTLSAAPIQEAAEPPAAPEMPEMPEPSSPQEQHEWLQQLVGHWDVVAEVTMGPGMEPMRMESTEHVRSIGGLWVISEGSASFGDMTFSSVLTLGYDIEKEKFVGTWIDTVHTHLWSYVGHLDDAGKVLTLETKGPAFDDPGRTAHYRDAIEVKGPDHRVMTSSLQMDDGTWMTFMRAECRRAAKKTGDK